jgi:acetolactate synthase-1/2/3 large subunit
VTKLSESWIEGGELLARTLHAAGVDTVFALHGGHLESFYRGCFNNEIRLIDFRHEASAGHAADGYARATGKLGVRVITAGPGFTNAATAILNAQLDSIPTLFIIGAPPLREDETNALQGGFDQIAAALPIVKYARRITNTECIQDLTALATRKAMTGRRGAVLLELPIDVLHMRAHSDDVRLPDGLHVSPRPAPHADEAAAAISILKQSERPAIIVDGEARFSDCRDDLIALAEAARIPVFLCRPSAGRALRLPHGRPNHLIAACRCTSRPSAQRRRRTQSVAPCRGSLLMLAQHFTCCERLPALCHGPTGPVG